MSTTRHPDRPVHPVPRPARCLRHHVWMAACGDCREAHGAHTRPAAAGSGR